MALPARPASWLSGAAAQAGGRGLVATKQRQTRVRTALWPLRMHGLRNAYGKIIGKTDPEMRRHRTKNLRAAAVIP